MSNWKENLGSRAVRVALVHPKSFFVGAMTATVVIGGLIGSAPRWVPLVGGPFVWMTVSGRDALENDVKNWRSRASDLEKARDDLIEKNTALQAKLATGLDRRQACDRLEREISAKEAQISTLGKAREDAVVRTAPLSVPLDGSRANYADARTPETDRYDADISLLNSSLQALRERATQNCI
ncbi:hypothetical protein [Trinickia diaoshuihuensis]|uniref:hypothetical protein n=1 Tax=Trinickia diaoshuihuensis TaxID=2292265 RepID=UPI000E225C8D|nr:hypothetical protein [Trinickia diaoshuihuensis]